MDRISRELAAYEAFSKWMKDGESVRQLFAEAGVPLPPRLIQFLGGAGAGSDERIIIPPPSSPKRPSGIDPKWIWVPTAGLLTKNLVLGVLRAAGTSMTPTAVIQAAVKTYGGTIANNGSVMNLGKPLEADGTISRSEHGWLLRREGRAPMLIHEFAWGPIEIFTSHEVAAHRRQLIVHVLKMHPSGLQQAQLVSALASCDWLNGVPVNKDLVKLDIDALAKEQRIRRVGATSKWEVTPV